MSAVIHIVGMEIQVGQQVRQRCGWCGAVISDMDLSRIAVQTPEGWDTMTEDEKAKASRPGSWPVGELVARDGNVTYVVEHEDGAELPPECCARLDHEVTA